NAERDGRQVIQHAVAEQGGNQAEGRNDADQNGRTPHALECGAHQASFLLAVASEEAADSCPMSTLLRRLRLNHRYRPLPRTIIVAISSSAHRIFIGMPP